MIKNKIRSLLPLSAGKINWSLILFLVLVLNVKLLVKVFAILLFTILNRRMLTSGILKNKFILFYGVMICIVVLNLFINTSSLSIPYLIVACTGIGFWLMSGFTGGLNAWYVKNNDVSTLHTTITFFFVINALVTFLMLMWIIFDAGAINPYTYQGLYQKYFISTGDRMTGISFDTSTTNAIFNAFGVVYFLSRRKFFLVLLCMSVLILTSSNLTNILLIIVMVYLFALRSDRNQKSIIVVCFLMLLIFLVKISPQNSESAINTFKKITGNKVSASATSDIRSDITLMPDSLLNEEERNRKTALLYLNNTSRKKGNVAIKPLIPKPNIHSEPYQMNTDTTYQQRRLLAFASTNISELNTNTKAIKARTMPGKVISFQQTMQYFKNDPSKLITGSGAGRFSSKLAFRATGLQMAGGFPRKFVYIDEGFLNNHLNLYITYFSKHKELHSLIHTPNSTYDQLIAEYGIAGLFSFIMLYLAFFIRKIRKLSYGVPMLMIMLGALAVDYWYEQLSIMILFEFLMLLNIKESEPANG